MRLLTGELDPDSEEGRAAFDAQPGLREELEELRQLEHEVVSADTERREILEQAGRTPTAAEGDLAPGEGKVASLVDAHFGRTDRARPPAPPTSRPGVMRWALPLAIAAAIALVFMTRSFRTSQPVDPGPVMGLGLRDLRPAGSVAEFTEFTWTSDAPAHYGYRVFVYDAAADGTSHEITKSRDLDEARWIPAPEDTEQWPETIRWVVHVLDGQLPVDVAEATASRD